MNAELQKIDSAVAKINFARAALAEAKTIMDVKRVLGFAEGARAYIQLTGGSKLFLLDAYGISVHAERLLGEMITAGFETGELSEGRNWEITVTGDDSYRTTLAEQGIARNLSARAQKFAAIPPAVFDRIVEEQKEKEELSRRLLLKAFAALQTEERRTNSRSAPVLPEGAEFRAGDCRVVLADLPDNSVPLILTDPPYGDEAAELYQWLAEFAARVLVPGGSLICYTGQSRLDRDMRIFSAALRYWWLLVIPHNKQSQRLPGKFVIANFKPILWYVKDYRRGRELVADVLVSSPPDKEAHNWAQGETEICPLIEQLTTPEELIVDPFAGTGGWGRAAVGMGRRWLGADIVSGGTEETLVNAE